MKSLLFLAVLLPCLLFGQSKEETLIDSVLQKHLHKTYQQYVQAIKQQEEKNKPSAAKMTSVRNEKGLFPSFSSIGYSKEYPLCVVKKKDMILGKTIYPSLNIFFSHIKSVTYIPAETTQGYMYGYIGKFGVYVINVE